MSDVSVQHEHVQSDGDFFSSKVEQSSVLVDDAYRQIRNAPYDEWQVNDLRRCFDILYPGVIFRENSCIVCTRSRSRYILRK